MKIFLTSVSLLALSISTFAQSAGLLRPLALSAHADFSAIASNELVQVAFPLSRAAASNFSTVISKAIVREAYPLSCAAASNELSIVAAQLSTDGSVTTVQDANAFVVTDRAKEMNRLKAVIARIEDASPQLCCYVRLLRHIPAADVYDRIAGIVSAEALHADAVGAMRPSVLLDERANRLIVSANRLLMREIDRLLSRLDMEDRVGVHVYRLRWSSAAKCAERLKSKKEVLASHAIETDGRNFLIVKCDEADRATIEDEIRAFDCAPTNFVGEVAAVFADEERLPVVPKEREERVGEVRWTGVIGATASIGGKNGRKTAVPLGTFGDIRVPDKLCGVPVTSIDDYAFAGCSNITSVTFPSTVTNIGAGAFFGCASLTHVTLPEGVTKIDPNAFRYCPSLTHIGIERGNPAYSGERSPFSRYSGGLLHDKSREVIVRCPCGIRGDVRVPAGVTTIAEGAFADCPWITSVSIPASVTNIAAGAFRHCVRLRALVAERGDEDRVRSLFASSCTKNSAESVAVEIATASALQNWRRMANRDKQAASSEAAFWEDAESCIRWMRSHINQLGMSRDGGIDIVGTNVVLKSTKVALPEKVLGQWVTEVSWKKLSELPITELCIPRSLSNLSGTCSPLGDGDGSWTSLTSFVVADDNTRYHSADGILYSSTILVRCPRARRGVVRIEDGTTRIANGAFAGCAEVTEVVFPSSVEYVGEGAFRNCARLESVRLSEGLHGIEKNAFDGCVKLFKNLERCDGYYVLDGWAIDPWGVGVDEHGVLSGRLTLPDTVHGIADQTFSKKIVSTATNETWTTRPLHEVSFPVGLRRIGQDAFKGTEIEKLVLPEGLFSIANDAFLGCTNLTSVTIPASVEELGLDARKGCSWTHRFGSYCRTPCYSGCFKLMSITIAQDNPKFASQSGVVYTKDRKKILRCPPGARSVSIPHNVTCIGTSAFEGCAELTDVDIPTSVTNIGHLAFSGCSSLRSVRIPDGMKELNRGVFSGCDNLTDINIPQSLKCIGISAFQGCRNITEVDIPEGVEKIGRNAFENCQRLLTIRVPKSLQVLEDGALGNRILPERILTAPDDAERIYKLMYERSTDRRKPSHQFSRSQEKRFRIEGDSLVRVTERQVQVWSSPLRRGPQTQKWRTETWKRWRDPVTGIAWIYELIDDKAVLKWSEYDNEHVGNLKVPGVVNGTMVVDVRTLQIPNAVTTVTIPASITNLMSRFSVSMNHAGGRRAPSFTDFMVDPSNPCYISVDGALYDRAMTKLLRCPVGRKTLEIPSGVGEVGYEAFCDVAGLEEISLPDSVTNICMRAFAGCAKLSRVSIPGTIATISSDAFVKCDALKFVDVRKDGKIERVPIDEFRKQWKLNGGVRRGLPGSRQPERRAPQKPTEGEQLKQLLEIQNELRKARKSTQN